MTETEIKAAVKIKVDLYLSKDFTEEDLAASMVTLIKDYVNTLPSHKQSFEHFIYQTDELLKNYAIYLGGKKSQKVACKQQGEALEKKINNLLNSGYTVNQFTGVTREKTLF